MYRQRVQRELPIIMGSKVPLSTLELRQSLELEFQNDAGETVVCRRRKSKNKITEEVQKVLTQTAVFYWGLEVT